MKVPRTGSQSLLPSPAQAFLFLLLYNSVHKLSLWETKFRCPAWLSTLYLFSCSWTSWLPHLMSELNSPGFSSRNGLLPDSSSNLDCTLTFSARSGEPTWLQSHWPDFHPGCSSLLISFYGFISALPALQYQRAPGSHLPTADLEGSEYRHSSSSGIRAALPPSRQQPQ